MFNFEFIAMAVASLRSNKLRSALTLLGMVIGVFAIIVAVTSVQVIESQFSSTIQSFGSTTFTVSTQGEMTLHGPGRGRPRAAFTYEQAERLIDRARLPVAISPVLNMGFAKARYGSQETDQTVRVFGSNAYWATNTNFAVEEGRFLTDQDVRLGRPVVVLGSALNEKLFPNESALAKDIVLDGFRYQVIGVLEEKGQAFGESQDLIAVVPITRVITLYGASERNLYAQVRAPSVDMLPATMDEVIGHLRVIRRVRAGEDNDFDVSSNEGLVAQVESFASIVAMGGAGVGLFTLLAAGIGIMNIMLVSVTERTREIGVRKAVGARRRDILQQFLYEAIFLCQIGGLFGILLGVLVGNLLGLSMDATFTFPWLWALSAVLGVTVIALVFGVYPAYKAARLDPIESLRYE